MRSSPSAFRSLSLPIYPVQRNRSVLLFIYSRSLHSAALSTVQSDPETDGTVIHPRNPPSCKIPRELLPGAANKIRKDQVVLGTGGGTISEQNDKLRRFSGVLHICALYGCLNEGKAIHGQVIKDGIVPDLHLWNSLVNVYAKCETLKCAQQVFEKMPERDVASWTILITGFVAAGYSTSGIKLFCEMKKEGIRPNECTFTTILKACSMSFDLGLGNQLHAQVIKIGAFLDVFVGSALVGVYSKHGEMELADRVFSCMPIKNAVSWNALLNGYAQMGQGEQVLKHFSRITQSEMKFSEFNLSIVLKGCADLGYLKEGQAVHSLVIKISFESLSCSLLDMYSKCGLVDDALRVFGSINEPNVVAWTTMISCLNQHGWNLEAACLFCQMRHAGVRPNQFTLASIASVAATFGGQHYCESIHACACKSGSESDLFLCNAIITMYMKIGSVPNGWQAFKSIRDPDLTSWNALLSGFNENGTCEHGMSIFRQMLGEGFTPDAYTFVGILGSCSSDSNISFGKQVHAHVFKNSLDNNVFVGTALIDMYAKSRCLEEANVIFNRLSERDIYSWTAIIAGYAQAVQGDKAIKCFSQMHREGMKPNEFTVSSCLSGCASLATLKNGQQIHSFATKAGLSSYTYVASALVDMYWKCRCIEDAETVFKGMVSRSIVLWNTIICGYSQHGQGEKALEAFRIMIDEGTTPDEITFIGVLSACSHMGLIEEGKKQFNSMSDFYGITPSIEHYACFVNILCRAGKFKEVESLIEELKLTHNSLIWETVLWACKMHENVELGNRAARKLFELEPKADYNYIMLSDIFAAKGRWDDVSKIRALMSDQGIKKEPCCSWVEVDAQAHSFFAQDDSHPKNNGIRLQLEQLSRQMRSEKWLWD
ncbi:putative pentatricopeptide repeat-containing protein At3g01580 [Malania oleifera]|uniref:putative pentatricopeptide repeat-containing protein At3g01580 n=1 Tax=Malania oleifera TaxID=397392 RepID=UPI0025AE2891|nr:putative pentatricopeptide repeat-containing protein At3g01580 [Malania oleifera]XP_057968570.1 putative pentatricopeptide repeat-containing protein At3g01580 [Malania oleifera]